MSDNDLHVVLGLVNLDLLEQGRRKTKREREREKSDWWKFENVLFTLFFTIASEKKILDWEKREKNVKKIRTFIFCMRWFFYFKMSFIHSHTHTHTHTHLPRLILRRKDFKREKERAKELLAMNTRHGCRWTGQLKNGANFVFSLSFNRNRESPSVNVSCVDHRIVFEDFEFLVPSYCVNASRNHDHENWVPERSKTILRSNAMQTNFPTAVENRVEFSRGGFFGLTFP